MCTIAIIGIDRYIRIKHYANFKALWTTRVVLTLILIEVFLSLLQAIMILIGLSSGIEYITVLVYFAIDGVIISEIIVLQILTIQTSNAIFHKSKITASDKTNKNPAETGRKLNVHKTFRRRLGRLLKVLCMFNLRPVPTGKISKLSMKIMLLFCCFIVPHAITFVLSEFIGDTLNKHKKSLFDFITVTTGLFGYINSFANAISFLVTNGKARRFMRSCWQ